MKNRKNSRIQLPGSGNYHL